MSEDKIKEQSCGNCTHGKMCLLRRANAEANQKCNHMIIPNDLALICHEYKYKEIEE